MSKTAERISDAPAVIVGGGAAGLAAACAIGRGAVVLEHRQQPGLKLLATGGGRCNLTHCGAPEDIAAQFGRAARFVAHVFRACPPDAIRAFFEDAGVATVVEGDGCVFPRSGRAADVRDALVRTAESRGVRFRCGCRAVRLRVVREDGGERGTVAGVETTDGFIPASRVILAAGGCCRAALGSDGSGVAIAREAGLEVVSPVPALVGLRCDVPWMTGLAGVSCDDVDIRMRLPSGAAGRASTVRAGGGLVFTHAGISGPAALAISGTVSECLAGGAAAELTLAVVGGADENDWRGQFARWRREHGSMRVANLMARHIPRALAQALCRAANVPDGRTAAALRRDEERSLARLCGSCPVRIDGTDGWDGAMVTRGGVALRELVPSTLACRRIANLHCIGEVVDVDAPCGGYNLSWAFAGGFVQGRIRQGAGIPAER